MSAFPAATIPDIVSYTSAPRTMSNTLQDLGITGDGTCSNNASPSCYYGQIKWRALLHPTCIANERVAVFWAHCGFFKSAKEVFERCWGKHSPGFVRNVYHRLFVLLLNCYCLPGICTDIVGLFVQQLDRVGGLLVCRVDQGNQGKMTVRRWELGEQTCKKHFCISLSLCFMLLALYASFCSASAANLHHSAKACFSAPRSTRKENSPS